MAVGSLMAKTTMTSLMMTKNRFKVETAYGATTIVEADYMEVGYHLVFKNRDVNTCIAAFSDWKSVVQVKEDE